MYTEERKGNLLKEFLMKLILVIIFVLLLIWLVPWPNMDSYIEALNPLKSQIFNANIQEMKDAAILYYTEERLPQEIGDTKTLTLQQMLDLKLLVPFVDKDGNSCDVTKSYVTIEKQETEYLLKVNLKCGEEEDYILVHIGCYAYCTSYVCEKEEDEPVKPVDIIRPTATPTSPAPTTTPTSTPPTPTTIPTPTECPTCTPCPTCPTSTPTNTPTDTPTTPPTDDPKACEVIDGKYYGKDGTEVDEATWIKECTEPTPTTTPTTTPTPPPTDEPDKEWEYRYKKYTPAYCANWSSWSTKMLKEGETLRTENTIYKVVEDLGIKRVQVGTISPVYRKYYVTESKLVQSSTYKYKVCKNYDYVINNDTIYQVGGDWRYTDEWETGINPPSQPTATSKWVAVGIDTNACLTCTTNPYIVWRRMVRSSSSSAPVGSSVTAECTEIEERQIPVYITIKETTEKTVMIEPEKPLYGDIHFYREKTCTDVRQASYNYVWSHYNDTNLLGQGYVYTGEYREKN